MESNSNNMPIFSGSSKYYHTLNSTFWTTNFNIIQKYRFKLDVINQSLKNCITEDEKRQYRILKEQLEKSHEVLLNETKKDKYHHFLFLNFIFSQPNTLEKLKQNFHNYVFPYYLFVIDAKNSSTRGDYLVIDFINLMINFEIKGRLENGILADSIKKVKKDKEKIILNSGDKNEMYFVPEIQQQRDLIYVLILLLSKLKYELGLAAEEKITEHNLNITFSTENDKIKFSNDKLDVEMNNFKLSDLKHLHDETYLPSGIILKSHVYKYKEMFSNSYMRYMVLGNSNIIIFKDETMRDICNVIPLLHCNILVHFDEENLTMKINLTNKGYIINFKSIDEIQIWRSTINDLVDSRIDEKIEDDIFTNFISTCDYTKIDDYSRYQNMIVYLDEKINYTEEKLKNLMKKKQTLIDFSENKKNELQIPLNDVMNSDNLGDYQESYRNKRMKRISLNAQRSKSDI